MTEIRRREFTTAGRGGLDLYAQSWLPAGPPRGVLLVAHGLGEHSGRYERLATEFVGHGYAVYAMDHRGHGKSPGPRANIERFEHVVSDFATFAGRAARQHLDTPVVMLGHSMGGAIVLDAALRMQQALRGLILSAPALGVAEPPPTLQRLVAGLLSVVAPNVGVLKLAPADVSRDPMVVDAYARDPLVHHAAVPARTLVELLRAMETFPTQVARLRLPTLVLHGTADRLVPIAGARPVSHAIDAKFRTLRVYEGLFHELFNEPERERVVQDVLQWLRSL